MTGNDLRLIILALSIVAWVAGGPPDIIIVALAGGLLFANWVADMFFGKQEHKQVATSPPQPRQQQVSSVNQPATNQVAGNRAIVPLTSYHPDKRQHTIIAAKPGDGKTTTSNTLLVEDCARNDVQVFVLNPHFTYYQPEDQTVDLRPLRNRFTVVHEYSAIAATLKSLYATVGERMALYRDGLEVGHTIVVYIDEWPAIASDDQHGKTCCMYLSKLIREARKVRIWIVLCSQDALVETLQLSGGLRASFHTCLVGNVDTTTWRQLTGGQPQVAVAKGTWYASGNVEGVVSVQKPTLQQIEQYAKQPHKFHSSLEERTLEMPQRDSREELMLQVADYLRENNSRYVSNNELERHFFNYTGGAANTKIKEVLNDARQLATTTTV